jgi:predicted dehydrogenase
MYCAIIGAGSIGALKQYEFDSICSKFILTHAHALYHFRETNLITDFYIVDKNFEKKEEAQFKWNCLGFLSLQGLKRKNEYIDVFTVSTSTEFHYDVLKEILEHFNPKLVIVEKPFCLNYKQALEIYQLYQKRKIQLVINYTRRFSFSIQSLRELLVNNYYGKVKACNVIYVRGFVRDASHALDLCSYFFGDFKTGNILGKRINYYDDYDQKDLTFPVWMEFEHCKNVYFTPSDGRDYSIFELDILTENARIQLFDHCKKTKIFNKKKEEVYGNFNSLDYENDIVIENNNLEQSLYVLYMNIFDFLRDKNSLICCGLDGLKVQRIYDFFNLNKNVYKFVGTDKKEEILQYRTDRKGFHNKI